MAMEISIDGPMSDGVPLPFIVTVQPTLIFFETAASPESPVELDSRKPRKGTAPNLFQNARTVLNAFYPGSFPDTLRLPFDDEPAKTAPELAPAAEPKPSPETAEVDRPLTLKEASEYLKLPPSTVRDLCKRKKLSHARINYRNWRFRRSDLDAYLAKRTMMLK
jgi:excisionase family DNA binding protein